jgi:hypothetical protein
MFCNVNLRRKFRSSEAPGNRQQEAGPLPVLLAAAALAVASGQAVLSLMNEMWAPTPPFTPMYIVDCDPPFKEAGHHGTTQRLQKSADTHAVSTHACSRTREGAARQGQPYSPATHAHAQGRFACRLG